MIIETGVLPQVFRRLAADPAIQIRLQALVDQFGSARDLQDCIAVDIQFHRALIEASGLQPLVAFNDLLVVFFQRFREAIGKVDVRVGIEHHQRLVDQLAAGQVAAATDELERHIASNKERL